MGERRRPGALLPWSWAETRRFVARFEGSRYHDALTAAALGNVNSCNRGIGSADPDAGVRRRAEWRRHV
jgi:hypothetical protein